MGELVLMVMIGWMPLPNGDLAEKWRVREYVRAAECLQVSEHFTGATKKIAITVRCEVLEPGHFDRRRHQ